MIVSVTMNPSVDISYPLDTLVIDDVNRCGNVRKTAGGKGLNVTRVIHQMGEEVVSTGLLGGVLGNFIREKLSLEGVSYQFSDIKGETRNCIAVLHDNHQQTEILESGPVISDEELSAFNEMFLTLAQPSDVVTLSGSLPNGVPTDYYRWIIQKVSDYDTKVVLDTSGNSLKEVLLSGVKPFAIKPNLEELHSLVGQTTADLNTLLNQPLFDGVTLIMISLGKDGAFVKYQQDFYRVEIPKISVKNPVGSGDSTVAGLAIGLANNYSIEDTIKTAMTLGMLNAMEETTGSVDRQHFDDLFHQIVVTN